MNDSVDDKVRDVQRSLDILRAEVDMKMSIMEQILSTRNEQFVLQKKLIEREHALYDNVITHWKNVARLAASGHSIRFSKATHDFHIVENNKHDSSSTFTKRTSTSAGFASESDRITLRAKRLRSIKNEESNDDSHFEEGNPGCDVQDIEDLDPLDNIEIETHSDGEGDGESEAEYDTFSGTNTAMEKKVFVNFFCAEVANPEEGSTDPVWLHFLHEEKGATALCKHCDNQGFQKIYQLKPPGLTVLRRHLKRKHKIFVEAPPATPCEEVEDSPADKKPSSLRKLTFLRYQDHLYKRYKKRNQSEYFRCRESETCAGRLIRRNGVICEPAEHSCLTTPADCDAAEFREKIRELAETTPLPPVEIIAVAKNGCSQDVLELIPNDESLRRTIRRIRQAMESVAPSVLDWT